MRAIYFAVKFLSTGRATSRLAGARDVARISLNQGHHLAMLVCAKIMSPGARN